MCPILPTVAIRSLLGFVALQIAIVSAGSASAEVAVLANRTASSVTVTLVLGGEENRTLTLPPGDSRPVFFSESVQARFQQGLLPQNVPLLANRAYQFTLSVQDSALQIEEIGLGKPKPEKKPKKTPLPRLALDEELPWPTIPVTILVDEDEPMHRELWETRLRKRIAEASETLQRHSGVKLKVVSVGTWRSDDRIHDFNKSLSEFERKVRSRPGELAIGFSSQYRIERGRVHLGGTRGPLYPYILLKERSPQVLETERLELLVHELGHYLSASHSPEANSVMRPVITGGLQRRVGARIQFDPVNTLLVAMMGDEIRHRGVRRLSSVSKRTQNRMRQIYAVLRSAMPRDPAAEQFLILLRRTGPPPLLDDFQRLLVQAVRRAEQLAEQSVETKTDPSDKNSVPPGDLLTQRLVRQTALAAEQLDQKNGPKAFLLALGILLDDTEILNTIPTSRQLISRVEAPAKLRERLAALGTPTMAGRADLAKHFFVSAHLATITGSTTARHAGLAKELLDAQGTSGFSFADMAANRAGIVFAEKLLQGPLTLGMIARRFTVKRFLPSIEQLAEGITASDLQVLYGGENGDRLQTELQDIEQQVLDLPVYSRP